MRSRAPVVVGGVGMNAWLRRSGSGVGGDFSSRSTGSEHDLDVMVSDFIEIGSAGAESWCSSDTDSGFSDLAYLADRISLYKLSVNDQYETDLLMVVKSLILSISEAHQETCDSSCILRSLVKLLQSSGYDAALCSSKWQNSGKVPGGEHEYIDVINGDSERYIIDIDFRSNFQIARAVKKYNVVLSCLPEVFVGKMTELKKILEMMVEAARYSLEQNSMPLPPWRSLPYLEAKWESPCQRILTFHSVTESESSSSHQHCVDLLRRLKSFILSDLSHLN